MNWSVRTVEQKEGIRHGIESGTYDKEDQRADDPVGCVLRPYGREGLWVRRTERFQQDHALPGSLRTDKTIPM